MEESGEEKSQINEKFLNYHDYIITLMKDLIESHREEFEQLTGELSETVRSMRDPVAIAQMLFSIAEERKSTNLIIRELNAKFDQINQKIEELNKRLDELLHEDKSSLTSQPSHPSLSERDTEVIEFIKEKSIVCAQDLKDKFNYKGQNAASARLSKLYHQGILEKIYRGRKVYYALKKQKS